MPYPRGVPQQEELALIRDSTPLLCFRLPTSLGEIHGTRDLPKSSR